MIKYQKQNGMPYKPKTTLVAWDLNGPISCDVGKTDRVIVLLNRPGTVDESICNILYQMVYMDKARNLARGTNLVLEPPAQNRELTYIKL